MKKRMFLAAALVAVLVGCSSGVKLNDVPVEDKTGSSVTGTSGTTTPGADAGSATKSNVAPVDLNNDAKPGAGPTGVARIIYFDYDSFVIKPEFQSVIEQHAQFIRANSARKVVIEGHTDERGGREYNLALGQKRAEAVRRALSLLGVPDSQVEAVSFGKEKPANPGHDEAAMTENRRAEIAYR
ncbi:MAG: peptidoglycan-associated lipoprotein Pal [Ramlibacter sp.]|nr:peptidoglycan-associated lipoprotein Pal [Ramlibacter sp.]